MVIDSFAMLEYAWPLCPSRCGLAYSPALRLREATGVSALHIVAAEFSLPARTSGLCRVVGALAPGQLADIQGGVSPLDPYDTYLTWWTSDGTPQPDFPPPTARIIVRDPSGVYGRVEATGTLVRVSTAPRRWATADFYTDPYEDGCPLG
jgi:hypothetical protein